MPSIETSWPLAEPVVLKEARPVSMAEQPLAIRRHFLAALGASMLILALLLRAAQLRIDFWQPSSIAYGAAAALLLGLRFGLPRSGWRHAGAVAPFASHVGLFMLISVMAAAASYPVAALTHGYADAALQRIDEALGFDWLHWYRLTASHRGLQFLETAAYRSIYVTPALLLWCMARAGEQERAWRFIATFWLAAVITLILFSLMPAVGPFSYLWHEPIHYMPESELWQQGLIPALRAHSIHAIDLGHLRGIVSAPSFHTAAATLYIAAGWRIMALRWPILVLNIAMLLSTPVEGTHYLIDMILGLGVALTALALMEVHRRHCAVSV